MHLFQVELCFDANSSVCVCECVCGEGGGGGGVKVKRERDKRNIWKEEEKEQEQDWLIPHNHVWSVIEMPSIKLWLCTCTHHRRGSAEASTRLLHRRSCIQFPSSNGAILRRQQRFNHKGECWRRNGHLSGRVVHLRGDSGETYVVEDWRTMDAWTVALCSDYKAGAFKRLLKQPLSQIRPPGSGSKQIFHPPIITNTFLWVNFSLFLKVMSQILNHRQRRKGRKASGATVAEVISQRAIFIPPQPRWSSVPPCICTAFQQRQTTRTWIVNSQMCSMVLWQRK